MRANLEGISLSTTFPEPTPATGFDSGPGRMTKVAIVVHEPDHPRVSPDAPTFSNRRP